MGEEALLKPETRRLLQAAMLLVIGVVTIRPVSAGEPPWGQTNRRYRILLSVDPMGQARSHSPAAITGLDFQQLLAEQGELGTFDEHTIEVVAFDAGWAFKVYDLSRSGYEQYLLPWRLEPYFGIAEVDLHFVMPDDESTFYAVYFDTVESGVGQPARFRGLVGDGDWFRQEYGRREIGPSKFGDMCDIDGDGDLDLFEAGVESFVYCYENRHDQAGENEFVYRGKLTSGGQVLNLPRSGANRSWMTVTFHDWDGDGDQDLFPSFTDGPDGGDIVYYRNTTSENGGQLTFTRVAPLLTNTGASVGGGGWFPTPTFVEDFDGNSDGLTDILVARSDWDGGHLYLHRNLGPGGAHDYQLANGVRIQAGGQDIVLTTPRFECVDIDGDTDLDLLATAHDWGYSRVYWYKNTGTRQNPVFAAAVELAALRQAYPGIKVADFHGNDGLLDIAIGTFWKATSEGTDPKSFGGLLKNLGPLSNPTFELRLADAGSLYTEEFQKCDAGQQNGVRSMDLDGDEDYDLMGSSSSGFILFFRNLTDNIFPVFAPVVKLMVVDGQDSYPVETYGPESGYARHDMSDWNNDGLMDLVVGDEEAKVSIFLNDGLGNDPPTFQPGDQLWANGKPLDCLKRGSPLVCDWNNDGKKDLVFGMAPKQADPDSPLDWPAKDDNKADDEGILYYENIGTDANPVLAYPSWVRAGGQIIIYIRPNMGNYVDWDGDGIKDFIGCDFEDNIRFYRNVGSGAAGVDPTLSPAAGVILVEEYCKTQMISGAEVMDWRGDGDLDILTGMGHAGSGLRYYERDYIEDVLNGTEPAVQILTPSPGAPGAVQSLQAAKESPGTAVVRWVNPSDSDVTGAVARYSTQGYPALVTDGLLAGDIPSTAGANVSFTHVVQTNQDLYYSVFAYDMDDNYSARVSTMATEPSLVWFDDTFDSYANGDLDGQGGWQTASGKNSCRVQSAVRKGSSGKAVEMFGTQSVYDDNGISTFGPIVDGYHVISFDMRGDPNVSGNQAIIEVYGLGQKITRVYWSQTYNLLYGPDGAYFTPIVPDPVKDRWYHIELGIDLDNRTMDAWVDGVRKATDLPMFQSIGQIDLIGLTGYGYEGTVAPSYIDNLRGEKVVPSGPLAALTDFDLDGDVDQVDFGHLQACLSPAQGSIDSECEDSDLNADGKVDAIDTGVFRLCMNGANVEPSCQ